MNPSAQSQYASSAPLPIPTGSGPSRERRYPFMDSGRGGGGRGEASNNNNNNGALPGTFPGAPSGGLSGYPPPPDFLSPQMPPPGFSSPQMPPPFMPLMQPPPSPIENYQSSQQFSSPPPSYRPELRQQSTSSQSLQAQPSAPPPKDGGKPNPYLSKIRWYGILFAVSASLSFALLFWWAPPIVCQPIQIIGGTSAPASAFALYPKTSLPRLCIGACIGGGLAVLFAFISKAQKVDVWLRRTFSPPGMGLVHVQQNSNPKLASRLPANNSRRF